jgi:hypothetical protein
LHGQESVYSWHSKAHEQVHLQHAKAHKQEYSKGFLLETIHFRNAKGLLLEKEIYMQQTKAHKQKPVLLQQLQVALLQ